ARQIQAVEMESAGVYRAVHGRVPFLAIRGISDVVGFKRHPDWTAYACHSAAAFARAFLLARPTHPRPHGKAHVLPTAVVVPDSFDGAAASRATEIASSNSLVGVRAAYRTLHIYHRKLFNLLGQVFDAVARNIEPLAKSYWGSYYWDSVPKEMAGF